MRISFVGYSFLAAPAAVTKIVSRGYKKIVYSRKINRKCCQRFVKTAAKFQDNIFKIEKIWATEFIDINIPTKLATSLTRFTICLLIRIIYKINGLYYTVDKSFEFLDWLDISNGMIIFSWMWFPNASFYSFSTSSFSFW